MYSAFLSLPTELRCNIYDYLLADSHAVTISAGYVTIFGNRIQDRARKYDIPGLPLDLAPLARSHYDASLLSIANPPEIGIDNGCMGSVEQHTGTLGMPAPLALQLSCHLVNDELTDYMRGRRQIKAARALSRKCNADGQAPVVENDEEGLSLHVTYPYGLLVLKNQYPYLLKQARRVYITGYYCPTPKAEPDSPTSHEGSDDERPGLSGSFAIAESFGTPVPMRTQTRSGVMNTFNRIQNANAPIQRPRLRLDPPLTKRNRVVTRTKHTFPPFSETTNTLATAALSHLIRTLFPPEPTQVVQLNTRILYTGTNGYGVVWNDSDSPVTHILRNVCGGKIAMTVKRGALATGLGMTVQPKADGRIVSTSWENWRPNRRGNRVRDPPTVGVSELDKYLTERS
ncbi:hypothetical protein BKA63DRAFT_415939 [Paraphoma chrysanthemicola]|nr:hypothetical protein BKA63DRAFT_415939 [Paraphoma chrysanthemicola]